MRKYVRCRLRFAVLGSLCMHTNKHVVYMRLAACGDTCHIACQRRSWYPPDRPRHAVTVCSLPRMQLSGSIPAAVGNLAQLTSLALYNNQVRACTYNHERCVSAAPFVWVVGIHACWHVGMLAMCCPYPLVVILVPSRNAIDRLWRCDDYDQR